VAQATVSIDGNAFSGVRLLGGSRFRDLVLVTVMPKMAGILPRLMLAIRPHRRPAKLERHEDGQKESDPKTHAQKYTRRSFSSDVNRGGLAIRWYAT